MWIVRLALRRRYTFVVMALLITILGVTSIVTMPTDIFPTIVHKHCGYSTYYGTARACRHGVDSTTQLWMRIL